MNEKHHFLPRYFVEISKRSNFSANYSYKVRLIICFLFFCYTPYIAFGNSLLQFDHRRAKE